MGILYHNIAKAVALRTGQVADSVSASGFETLYAGSLASLLAGFEIPASELQRMVLAAVKNVASVCVSQKNPVFKQHLAAVTGSLADKADIATYSSGTSEWIGAFEGVFDASNHEQLLEKPLQTVRRYIRLIAANEILIPVYHFCFVGRTIRHTRTNVYLRGYKWDSATQATAYTNNTAVPIIPEAESWVIAEALAMAAQEGWFVQEAGTYQAIADAEKQRVQQGLMPSAALPAPGASLEPVAG